MPTSRSEELRAAAARLVAGIPADVAPEVVVTGSVSRGVADDVSDVEMLLVTRDQLDLDTCFELARPPVSSGSARGGRRDPRPPASPGYFEEIPFELIWWSREYADASINARVAGRGRDRERRLAADVRPARRLARAAAHLPGRARGRADRGRGADVGRIRRGRASDDRAPRRAARARRAHGRRRVACPADGLRDQPNVAADDQARRAARRVARRQARTARRADRGSAHRAGPDRARSSS